MDIKFRTAKLSDIELLNKFQHGIGIHERKLDSNIKKQGRIIYYTKLDLQKAIKSRNSLVLIVEINNKPVGCGLASISKMHGDWSKFDKKGYIGLMYVMKEYRGKGLGSKILNYLLNWLKKKKIKDIRLQVYCNNDIAVNAYKKGGFKEYISEMIYRPD